MITHETLYALLTIPTIEQYLDRLPQGSVVGVAEDHDALLPADWAHDNVVARYLTHTLSLPRITVDYSGITLVGECEELLYDPSLAWIEFLLRALDAMLAGTHSTRLVTREQMLAFLHLYTLMENTRVLEERQRLPEQTVSKGNVRQVQGHMQPDEASFAPYLYTVYLSTSRLVSQEVTIEANTPLTGKEISERALANLTDNWEPGRIDPNPDVAQIVVQRSPQADLPLSFANE